MEFREARIKQAADIIKAAFAVEGRAAVGVSGGVDSMSLLHLIVALGFSDRIVALHVDHQLRQSASRDARIVQDFCAKNGVEFKLFTADVAALAKKSGRSIETEARELRRDIFFKEGGKVFLAHTMDDNVESVLMHIFRGSGLNGLVGMSECDGRIIRPFIGVKKSDLLVYAQKNDIPFGFDESNLDTNYRRNHLRKVILELENSFPALKNSVMNLSKIAKKTTDYIESQLDFSFISTQNGAVLLSKQALKTPLASEYILAALDALGVKTDILSCHIAAVAELSVSGKSLDLPHNVTAYCEKDHIAFTKKRDYSALSVPVKMGKTVFFDYEITAEDSSPVVKKGQIVVDWDCLGGAVWRTRRQGDRFTPCGRGEKKLKDYLIDSKIPNWQRDSLPVLAIGSNVLVAADMELSDSVKITDKTTKAVHILIESRRQTDES